MANLISAPDEILQRYDNGDAQLNLWPRQNEVFESQAQQVFVFGSKQSGKTLAGHASFCNYISSYTKEKFLLMAPDWHTMDVATVDKFFEVAEPWGIVMDRKKDYNQSMHRIADTARNNQVFLRVAKDWERLQSMTLKGAMFDECQVYPHGIYREIQARLAIRQGRLWANFTVPSPSQIRSHWIWPIYEEWRDGNTNYEFIKFVPTDSPLWTKERLEQQRNEYSPEEFRAYFLGDMDVQLQNDLLYDISQVRRAMERHKSLVRIIPDELYDYLYENQTLPRLEERTWTSTEKDTDQIIFIGCDPAGADGKDKIGVTVRFGKIVVLTEDWGKMPQTELEGRLIAFSKDIMRLGFNVKVEVDSIGGGEGIPYHLQEEGVDTDFVKYSYSAEDGSMFTNQKSELYWQFRELFKDPEFCIPDSEDLFQQIVSVRWAIADSKGRRKIQDQEPSPDLWDSIVCACRELQHGGLQVYIPGMERDMFGLDSDIDSTKAFNCLDQDVEKVANAITYVSRGLEIVCSFEEYLAWIRSALDAYAILCGESGQPTLSKLSLFERQRLDKLFGYLPDKKR